jgi:capsular polysaccharide transport system permease protein
MTMNFERPAGFHADAPVTGTSTHIAPESRWFTGVPWLFVSIVLIPTLLTALYYLLIAAPQYVSEAQFVVRTRSQGQPAAFGSILQSVGVTIGQSETDAFEVQNYMMSRDAAGELSQYHQLRSLLARPESDFLARFPRPFEGESFENLYKNYKRFVTVGYDSQTGISTLRVQAFRAADAHELADALLNGSENLVNRLNDRTMSDALALAQRQVLDAEARVFQAQANLTNFRNRERTIDPDRASVAGLDLVGKLEIQLDTMRAEREGLAASAPKDPQLPLLDKRIAAFSAQIDAERSHMAGETNSLAPQVGDYERLTVERDIAIKSLEVAESTFETARQDVQQKQLYLERVVNPNRPDQAEQPRRLKAIFTVLVSALVAYGAMSLVIAGLREHRQH